MKLKKLTIDNIASIEHAEIDFSAAPLKDEHLFLITGETGSGKSTIIDCLCLALYGSTPRLESANRREGGYEDVNNGETIKAYDPKQLLRRGTVSASVVLTFDDNNGIPYTATWSVRRAHKKLENNIMAPERSLQTDEGVNPPVDLHKIKEINDHIVELIGLDMNEFFRTVVLAQGKFAEFLNSNETQKATLLEKMTGTELFTQLGQKIFEVFREKENERNNLLTLLQSIALMDKEQQEQIKDEIGQYSTEQATLQQRRDGAKKMSDWLDEMENNQQNLARKVQDLEGHLEKTRDAEFLARQQLVSDWEATVEARRELRDKNQASRHIQSLLEQQPAMQAEFDLLCAALRATVNDVEKKREKVDEIGRFLQQEEGNRAMYDAIKTIKTLMGQRKGEQDNITTFSEALDTEIKLLPGVEKRLKEAHSALEQQEQLVKGLQARYDELKVADINARKDAVAEAKQALTELKVKHDAISQTTDLIEKRKDELVKEQQTLDKEKAVMEGKRALRDQAHEALEREKDWNALIEQAHKSLHEGQTCPVCGNTIGHLQAPKGKNVLDQLRQQLNQAEEQLSQSKTAMATADNNIKRLKRDIGDLEKELELKIKNRDQYLATTQRLLANCGKNVDEIGDNAQADALIEVLDKDLNDMKVTLQQATTLNGQITTERNKLSLCKDAHNQAMIHLSKANDSIKYQKDAIARSKEKLEQITSELDGLFAMSNWQEVAAMDDSFISGLEQHAATYQHQVKLQQQLESAIHVAEAVIPAMQENKANITGLIDNGKECDQVPEKLDERWRQLENKHLQWNSQLDNERENARSAQQALDDYLQQHEGMSVERLADIDQHAQAEIADIKLSQQQLAELITHTRGEIASLKSQQAEISGKKPDFTEQDRDELDKIYQNCQERIEQLTHLIAERMAALKADDENRKLAGQKQEAFEAADAEYQQWRTFNEMLGDSTGARFRKIAQSYILGELLACANDYLRHFNDRYTLEAKPGTLTILVRDQLQSDLTTVNTLSGGEGFMVSLALALALSSTTGKMFSVDTLFIDEGFGSLSHNYIHKVMETLNRLYDMGGKRVGIISHVEQLKESVTAKIEVARDKKNTTVSRVTVKP